MCANRSRPRSNHRATPGAVVTPARHREIALARRRRAECNEWASSRVRWVKGAGDERLKTARPRGARQISSGSVGRGRSWTRLEWRSYTEQGPRRIQWSTALRQSGRCPRRAIGAPDPVVPSIRLTARELLEQYRCLERVASKICRGKRSESVFALLLPESPSPESTTVLEPRSGSRRAFVVSITRGERVRVSRNYRSRHSGSGAVSGGASRR